MAQKQIMKKLNLADVLLYIEQNIGKFHAQRVDNLNKLQLKTVLKKKNPYLFKAKHLLTADAIVKSLTDAFISSNEETIFGDWLEGLAIFINSKVYDGRKSGINGIDLEFDLDGNRYLVAIKSGPNWCNKSQKEKMLLDFLDAKRTLSTSNSKLTVVAVNGCCYGKDGKPHKFPKKGIDYFKFCGQRFWEFISGDADLYTEIVEPLGYKARERNEEFLESYARMINKFTKEFINDFCKEDGAIDWNKFVKFNSGK